MSDHDQRSRETALARRAGASEETAARIAAAGDAASDWRITCPECRTVRLGTIASRLDPCPTCGFTP